MVHRPEHPGQRELVAASARGAIQVSDPGAVPHVARVLMTLGRAPDVATASLRDLQELVYTEREAFEVGDYFAMIHERRGRPFPEQLLDVRRVRIDEQIVRDLAPANAGAEEMDAQRLLLREVVPHAEGEVLDLWK